MLICLAKFALRLADFDEVRSGLNTGEAHQKTCPARNLIKDHRIYPTLFFPRSDSNGTGHVALRNPDWQVVCLVFCPAKPSSNRFGVNSSWSSRPVGLALRKRVSRIARTQHIGFGSVPKGLLASSSELLPLHGLGEAPPDSIAYLPKATTRSASPPGAFSGVPD
jgi:hypothetical protein